MTEENVTGNMIAIQNEEGETVNVDPELLRQYKEEAFEHLVAEKKAKTLYKEVLDAMADTVKLKKGVLNKWLKAKFKDETNKQKQIAEQFDSLDAAVEVKTE